MPAKTPNLVTYTVSTTSQDNTNAAQQNAGILTQAIYAIISEHRASMTGLVCTTGMHFSIPDDPHFLPQFRGKDVDHQTYLALLENAWNIIEFSHQNWLDILSDYEDYKAYRFDSRDSYGVEKSEYTPVNDEILTTLHEDMMLLQAVGMQRYLLLMEAKRYYKISQP